MEVRVEVDGQLDKGQLLVLTVSSAGLATTSTEWKAGKWHRLLPVDHLASTPGTEFLVLSEAVLTKHNGVSITRAVAYHSMQGVAALCTNRTTDKHLACTDQPVVLDDLKGVKAVVNVAVRMDRALCKKISTATTVDETTLLENPKEPIKGDTVKLGYRIGLNTDQTYARWAAASYRPQQHGIMSEQSLARFGRQVELAALLFGYSLLDENLKKSHLCAIAAEVCTMPLRAHGVYVVDEDVHPQAGRRDRPTMPFFGEEHRFAAFDCEDAAMFIVSEQTYLWSLLCCDTGNLSLRLAKGGCNPAAVDTVASILDLAKSYIPLHIVVGKSDSKMLHVAVLMVTERHLPYLFGDEWKSAVPETRRKFLDATASLPARFVDACNLIGDVAVIDFEKGRAARDKRFLHTVSHTDTVYGELVVAGVYGARVGVSMEGESRAIKTQLATLLAQLNSPVVPSKLDSWRTFTYAGPGALTLLPGADMPVDRLSQEPVPISTEVTGQPKRVVMTRDAEEKRSHDLRLFDGMPVVGMIYETK
jgi:hypothetical protein